MARCKRCHGKKVVIFMPMEAGKGDEGGRRLVPCSCTRPMGPRRKENQKIFRGAFLTSKELARKMEEKLGTAKARQKDPY